MNKVILFIDNKMVSSKQASDSDQGNYLKTSAGRIVSYMDMILEKYGMKDEIILDSSVCIFPDERINLVDKNGDYISDDDCFLKTKNQMKQIMEKVDGYLELIKEAQVDRLEIVMDVCIDGGHHPESSMQLVKYLLKHVAYPNYFFDKKMVITMVSKYTKVNTADFNELLSAKELEELVICHTPVYRENDHDYYIDEEEEAFPEYFKEYQLNGKDERSAKINDLLNQGTFFGNLYGLILARLYQ